MNKTFVITLLICLTVNSFYSQDNWIQKSNFPGGARIRATAFTINEKAYFGLGFNSVTNLYCNDFWEYDPQIDTWKQLANFPGTARQNAASFSIDYKGYVGTGAGINGLFFDDFWEYNSITDQWVQKASLPGGIRTGAIGFAVNGKGYIGLGNATINMAPIYYNDMWEYDPVLDTWFQKQSFPNGGRADATVFVINGKAYIGGGGVSQVFKDFFVFNPSTNVYNGIKDYLGGVFFAGVGFSIGGTGYVGTGSENSFSKLDTFISYNPITDIWVKKANFPAGKRTLCTGFSLGNKGYIGTGYLGGTSWPNDLWEYNPDTILMNNNLKYSSLTSEIFIYPNPLTDFSIIQFENNSNHIFIFQLFNSLGQMVKEINNISNENIVIHKDELKNGIYFFYLHTEQGDKKRYSGRFIMNANR